MRIGVVFPQTEFGNDTGALKAYLQTVEALGYTHLLAYDHVLGADLANRPNWTGSYELRNPFHEVFVLFGYAAALTERLELVTGVLILPQRQTALVAKQAAEVDVLSNGRMRLGIGVGWNAVEYEALGEAFSNRGVRSQEQMQLLRALWTNPSIIFDGQWDQVVEAGINPLPVQQPIPIWIGGYADSTLRRIATFADGWFPWREPNDAMAAMLEKLWTYTREAGRNPSEIGLEPRLDVNSGSPDVWHGFVEGWRRLGATHLCVNTMSAGFRSPAEHISALERVAQELGVVGR
ncbi:MAG: LLM class F420-dependent oxidoreductase [Thermomicrobiales bacterium]|nr:LLM class F420-dependent oxidoreductase [Thermomicrobiales bacterium]